MVDQGGEGKEEAGVEGHVTHGGTHGVPDALGVLARENSSPKE